MQTGHTDHKNTEWSEPTKRTVAIAGVLVGVFVLYVSRPVLPYILLAGILAFLLNPVVGFFRSRLRLPHALAVAVTYTLLLIAMLLIPLILTPGVVMAVRDVNIDLVEWLDTTTAWLQQTLEDIRLVRVLSVEIDLSPAVDPALETLTGVVPEAMIPSPEQIYSSIPSAVELATGLASTVVSTVLWTVLAFLFTLIYAIYISLDLPKFGTSFWELVPTPYRGEYRRLWTLVRNVWTAFFRGQLILAVIIGVVVGVGNTVLGTPAALVLGILAGLLEAFPNIGPVLAAIPAVILALLQGSSVLPVSNLVFALIVMGFYVVVQQLENNIIVPRLIGHAVDLPPVLVMAGVVVGASVAGILGAFMAVPIIATGRIVAQYSYNKVVGRPPFAIREEALLARAEVVTDEMVEVSESRVSAESVALSGDQRDAMPAVAAPAGDGRPGEEEPTSVTDEGAEAPQDTDAAVSLTPSTG